MFWLAEDRCVVAQSAASRNAEGRLDLHLRLRGLQFGAHAEPDAQRSSDVVSRGRSVSEWSCNASLGRSVARKITPQMLENPRITQTDQEIAGSARFFRSLLGFVAGLPRQVHLSVTTFFPPSVCFTTPCNTGGIHEFSV